MKPSQTVIDRIREEVRIRKLCIEKNVISNEFRRGLYWESYNKTGKERVFQTRIITEYYTEWWYGVRDYWGETDEFSLTETLCVNLCDGPYTDDEDYPPVLTKEQLIAKLEEMEVLKEALFV